MESQQRQNQQIQQAPQLVEVSAKGFAAKYSSKREVYNFLAVDVGVYLPHFDQITIYFLKDLAHGKKKRKCPITPTVRPGVILTRVFSI